MSGGYIYGFKHPLAPDRIKIGVTSSDPHIDIASNRKSRANQFNAGLQLFGQPPVSDAFPPKYVEDIGAVDKLLKTALLPFSIARGSRGQLREVYIIETDRAIRIIDQVIAESMKS